MQEQIKAFLAALEKHGVRPVPGKKEYLPFPGEFKLLDEAGTFEGYGSVFDELDDYQDVIKRGAYKKTLKENAKKGGGTHVKLLWMHDPRQPIGVYADMFEDEKGLYVKGQLALNVQQGREAYELLKLGALDGLSIGFTPIKWEIDAKTQVRTLKEIRLWEVSLVTWPANAKARVTGVKEAPDDDPQSATVDPQSVPEAEREPLLHSLRQLTTILKGGVQ